MNSYRYPLWTYVGCCGKSNDSGNRAEHLKRVDLLIEKFSKERSLTPVRVTCKLCGVLNNESNRFYRNNENEIFKIFFFGNPGMHSLDVYCDNFNPQSHQHRNTEGPTIMPLNR